MTRTRLASLALAAGFAVSVAAAQNSQPAFEVASVKISHEPSSGLGGYVGIRPGGSVSIQNVSLDEMIHIAYSLEGYRVSGGPGWISTSRYNVDAKPAGRVSHDEAALMFQSLLAERFHLRTHRENRTVDGYTLTAPKGDAKLQKLAPDAGVGFRRMTAGQLQGPGTLSMLARTLKGMLQAPVEDRTGLQDKYEFALEWSTNDTAPDGKPSVFGALSELGLALKPAKVSLEVLIVDSAEKLTEN
jgi:uncharacterized protein (TIGR03435 family)